MHAYQMHACITWSDAYRHQCVCIMHVYTLYMHQCVCIKHVCLLCSTTCVSALLNDMCVCFVERCSSPLQVRHTSIHKQWAGKSHVFSLWCASVPARLNPTPAPRTPVRCPLPQTSHRMMRTSMPMSWMCGVPTSPTHSRCWGFASSRACISMCVCVQICGYKGVEG